MTLGQRFARLATSVLVRLPALWPIFRPLLRRQFDRLAPEWDEMRAPRSLEPYQAALEVVPGEPRRALDLGTGTGAGAFRIARRWPGAEVVGADIAEGMLEEARARMPPELAGRVRFELADATRLPYAAGAFDLIALANMIPFPRELARALAPGGHLVVAFSRGDRTPIYVSPGRLRRVLERNGFAHVADLAAGEGISVLARRAEAG
jgi:SAM-dependent methyltransferase